MDPQEEEGQEGVQHLFWCRAVAADFLPVFYFTANNHTPAFIPIPLLKLPVTISIPAQFQQAGRVLSFWLELLSLFQLWGRQAP